MKTIKAPCSSCLPAHPLPLNPPTRSFIRYFPKRTNIALRLLTQLLFPLRPKHPKNLQQQDGKALRFSHFYHFSFPCEFHGECFSHGPGETSEPVNNPFTRRRVREGKQSQIVPDVEHKKKKKASEPQKKKEVPNRRCEFPSASQNTQSAASAQTPECCWLGCLSACLSKGSPFF